jgi:exopolyphosphatase / guanosine-5'-triphosphate,3'-diphosphate pyrophosphatase
MRLAVIDVGSNTARLLVVDVLRDGGLSVVAEDRAFLELGAEPGADRIKLAELGRVARHFVSRARKLRVDALETIVTAPGRGPRGTDLVRVLRDATGDAVRVLTAEEEGCLAYAGAIAGAHDLPEVVAVVDVGGGSSELVVGTPWLGGSWVRSLELGSLSLTRAYLHDDPPSRRQLADARDAVRCALAELDPPWSDVALATGGSARAVAKIAGNTYSADELVEVVSALAAHPVRAIPDLFGISARRARTVVAGTIVLAELAHVLRRPLVVARGGLREGAALALAADAAARAAA